jgi:hypothetical protein
MSIAASSRWVEVFVNGSSRYFQKLVVTQRVTSVGDRYARLVFHIPY